MKRWLVGAFAAVVVAGVAGIVAVTGVVAYNAVSLPLPDTAPVAARQPSLTLRAADGSPLGNMGIYRGDMLRVDELPRHAIDAVLAIEDRRFYEHGGIDLTGIARAAWTNVRAGAIAEGGSTITQQLARTMFLSPERTMRRKLQEAMIAVWLERRLSKDEILARYLNAIYFGAGAWGIDGASRRYFGKSARDLTLAEAAMVAGLIQAPSTYAPTRDLRAARQRAAVVLDAMVATGLLEAQAAAAAKDAPIQLAREPAASPGSRYFADWAASQAAATLNAGAPPVLVDTTLDPELQRLAEETVATIMQGDQGKSRVGQAALVAMRADGAVLAMVGGTDYGASQFNRAIQARRQAGSLFKLFVYAAASQHGYTADKVLVDQPVRIGAWEPSNFNDHYRGPVSLRTAFAQSLNSIAIQLGSDIGWSQIAETARSMGVASPLMPVPALSLGAADVTLLEMTAAFAAVAADRARVQPHAVRRMTVGDQVLDLRPAEQPGPTWNREMMLDLLAAVMRNGTAAGAALKRPSAGKTGTSQGYRDAWFVGFTSDVIVGVWVGNDDNSPMEEVTGSKLPAQIWHEFMVAADRIKMAGATRPRTPPVASAGAPPGSQYAALPEAGPTPYVSVTQPPGSERAEPAGMSIRVEPPSPVEGAAEVAGVPVVLDPGTLSIGGRVVKLFGVVGDRRFTAQMQRFIAGRPIHCQAIGDGTHHRCEVGGHDLSRVVLYNGGGRSSTEAPPPLAAAEQNARSARRGLWGG